MRRLLPFALFATLLAVPVLGHAAPGGSAVDSVVAATLKEAKSWERPDGRNASAGAWAGDKAVGRYGGPVQGRTWPFRFSLFGSKSSTYRELGLKRDAGALHVIMSVKDGNGPGKDVMDELRGRIVDSRTTAAGDTVLKVHFNQRDFATRQFDAVTRSLNIDIPVKDAQADTTFVFKKDGTLSLKSTDFVTRGRAYSLIDPTTAFIMNSFLRTTFRGRYHGVLEPL